MEIHSAGEKKLASLYKEAEKENRSLQDSEERRALEPWKSLEMQTPTREQHILHIKNSSLSFRDSPRKEEKEEEEETSRSALSAFRAKEEQIERKKVEVREKVFAQLGRVEEETKRLAGIREVS